MCCKNKATIVLKTVQNIYLVAKNEKCQDNNAFFDMEIVKIKGKLEEFSSQDNGI